MNVPLTPEQVQRLRALMDAHGWDQAELSRKSGVTKETVGDTLHRRRSPRKRSLAQMCEALGVTIGHVLVGEDPPAQARPLAHGRVDGRPRSLGVDRWLADTPEGRGTSELERELMRAVMFPDPYRRYPDLVYLTMLTGFRHALAAEKSPLV